MSHLAKVKRHTATEVLVDDLVLSRNFEERHDADEKSYDEDCKAEPQQRACHEVIHAHDALHWVEARILPECRTSLKMEFPVIVFMVRQIDPERGQSDQRNHDKNIGDSLGVCIKILQRKKVHVDSLAPLKSAVFCIPDARTE
jgi:hypothetical protein